MSGFLIRTADGELVHTLSLDGYEGFEIVAEGSGCKPKDDHDWDGEKWCRCPVKTAERKDLERCAGMTRAEMVRHFEAQLAERDARLDALERLVDGLKAQ